MISATAWRRSGERSRPRSCDTFVSVGGEGAGHTIFGKNSDRPATEAHEVVRFARAAHPPGTMLQCQYIQIPQAPSPGLLHRQPSFSATPLEEGDDNFFFPQFRTPGGEDDEDDVFNMVTDTISRQLRRSQVGLDFDDT